MFKFIIAAFILLFISNHFINLKDKPIINITKQESAYNYNPLIYQFVSLGNRRLFADILWISTLLEGDLDHYTNKDFNNWMYLRFDTILKLDPYFLEAYKYGGQYLSIIKDDDLGAKDIYDRGLLYYPDDYFLNWNCGYHYLHELNDRSNSLKCFMKIIYHPSSPSYLPSLIAKIKAEENLKESALVILEESLLKINPNEINLLQKIKNDITKLKIELDLICLNSNKTCKLYSPEGVTYIKKGNIYQTEKKFERLKLFKRDDK